VKDADGSAWVVEDEHPDVRESKARLLILEPDGRIRKEIASVAGAVVIDNTRNVAWTAGNGGILKLSLAGEILATIPIPASPAVVEPDTGYVWALGPKSIERLDCDGRVVKSITFQSSTWKTACLLQDQ
jgi:hypothetical protein